jgi:uncharacterized protein (DUF362 family)
MDLRPTSFALVLVAACSGDPPTSGPSAVASAIEPAPVVSGSSAAAASGSADAVSGASPTASASAGPTIPTEGRIVDGAALRKKNVARLREDKSPVTVVSGDDPRALGKTICEAVVPKRPPATPVLIKPNLCGFDAMKRGDPDNGVTGRTTHPEFVRGIVQCLKARGHTKITVAEGCSVPHKQFLALADLSGYAAMTKEEGVSLVALDDDGVFDVEGDQPGRPLAVSGLEKSLVPTLLLPKAIADHLENGMWISAPKIKTHRFSVTSVAIKGMQGIVMRSDGKPAHTQKWRMHAELLDYLKTKKSGEDRAAFVRSLELFSDRMADVLEVAAPDAVLAEGAPAMGGDGFQVMTPMPRKLAIGGTHPLAVDKVAAEYLGLWDSEKLAKGLRGYKTSPLGARAAERFGLDLGKWPITGDGAALLSEKRPVHFVSMAPFVVR